MPSCDIYLVLPPDFDAGREMHLLTQAIEIAQPAALRLATTDATAARRAIAALKPVAAAHDIALILTDLPALAREQGCDGVHLSVGSALISTARDIIGNDLQLGIACGPSRDEAMQAGEAGADYIALTPEAAEIVAWWTQVMELPVVAESSLTTEDAARMIASGADFLTVTLDGNNAEASLQRLRDAVAL